jgi:hypothetical protein
MTTPTPNSVIDIDPSQSLHGDLEEICKDVDMRHVVGEGANISISGDQLLSDGTRSRIASSERLIEINIIMSWSSNNLLAARQGDHHSSVYPQGGGAESQAEGGREAASPDAFRSRVFLTNVSYYNMKSTPLLQKMPLLFLCKNEQYGR